VTEGKDGVALRDTDRNHYADAFEQAPIARLITDKAGVVMEANRRTAELLDVAVSALVGQPLAAFVAEEDIATFRDRMLEAVETAAPMTWVAWLRLPGGSPFPADVHLTGGESETAVLHWAIADVTERTAMEEEFRRLASEAAQALRERVHDTTREAEAERARLAAVVEQIPAGLVIFDSDGSLVTANGEARRLLQNDAGQLTERIPAGEAGRAEFLHDDGTSVVLEVSTAPIIDREGTHQGVMYLFRDISAREQQERTEREFVTNAAHQIQSPLAGILSAIEVLQAGAKDRPERDVFLGHIERESQRLARLARALLILARAQTGYEAPKDEVIALGPLLREVADSLRPGKGVEIHVECPTGLAVITNSELIEQALVNVAENSAKYTAAGRIDLEGRAVGDAVEIVVSDTGDGIPIEDRDRVLDRFYRAANGSDGFGLGFAIVRSAVEALDGQVELQSEVGAGTTVTIRLPRAATLIES
jgi:PAS domain S-box-containing protein